MELWGTPCYTELMAWLEQDRSDPIHIACIQESHWPQYSEYSTDRWTVIGTGTGSSAAGVLFIINKSAVASDSVKYSELIPGRALQVRMQTDPPLDLLGVYQYAWNPRKKSLRHMSAEAQRFSSPWGFQHSGQDRPAACRSRNCRT